MVVLGDDEVVDCPVLVLVVGVEVVDVVVVVELVAKATYAAAAAMMITITTIAITIMRETARTFPLFFKLVLRALTRLYKDCRVF